MWKYTKIQEIESEIWVHLSKNHEVSNMGRLRNRSRLLCCGPDNNGYPAVSIKLDDGSVLATGLHIIVARYFVKNEFNLPWVNHIDGNKTNAKASNLEWCTPKQNAQHAVKAGLKSSVRKVIQVDTENRQIGEIYDSCMIAAKALNVNGSSVNKVCRGELRSCGPSKVRFRFLGDERSSVEHSQAVVEIAQNGGKRGVAKKSGGHDSGNARGC